MAKRKVMSFVLSGSTVSGLYDDDKVETLKMLGGIDRAEKISDIRFNPKGQKWEVVDRKTGKVVATDRSRKKAVQKEHDFYERMISRGRIPWKE